MEDLASFISIADIAIVPITRGSGTRLKLLDYLASGIPIVSTRRGAEGIAIENTKHALISNDVNQDFIDQIICLYEDKERRNRIAQAGRKLAEKMYDWRKISQKLYNIYEKVMK